MDGAEMLDCFLGRKKPTDERWRGIRHLITVNDSMKEYQSFGLVGYHVWLWLYFDTSISVVSACKRY